MKHEDPKANSEKKDLTAEKYKTQFILKGSLEALNKFMGSNEFLLERDACGDDFCIYDRHENGNYLSGYSMNYRPSEPISIIVYSGKRLESVLEKISNPSRNEIEIKSD